MTYTQDSNLILTLYLQLKQFSLESLWLISQDNIHIFYLNT